MKKILLMLSSLGSISAIGAPIQACGEEVVNPVEEKTETTTPTLNPEAESTFEKIQEDLTVAKNYGVDISSYGKIDVDANGIALLVSDDANVQTVSSIFKMWFDERYKNLFAAEIIGNDNDKWNDDALPANAPSDYQGGYHKLNEIAEYPQYDINHFSNPQLREIKIDKLKITSLENPTITQEFGPIFVAFELVSNAN